MAESTLNKIRRLFVLNLKYLYNCIKINRRYKDGVTCLIFSRNRAMQLDALIKSIQRYSKSSFKIIVQYSYSPAHEKSYREVINLYNSKVEFVKENKFSDTLLELLNKIDTKNMFFLCDDQIFISDFDIEALLKYKTNHNILSMRLGKNITNFGIEDIEYTPIYLDKGEILTWNFKENKKALDWCYQFSVDGTIYSTLDVVRASNAIPFKAPNSYEANMNSVLLYHLNNKGVTWSKPAVVNLLINASRKENDYSDCVSGEYTPDDLLDLYNDGKRIDVDKVSSLSYKSPHHIIYNINDILS